MMGAVVVWYDSAMEGDMQTYTFRDEENLWKTMRVGCGETKDNERS